MPIKFEKFVKLMALTTSSIDGEALSALRKANAMLDETNMTWEQLLAGKVKFVRDEFGGAKSSARRDYEKRSGARPHRPGPEPQAGWYYAEDFGPQINEMFEFIDRQLAPDNSFRAWVSDVYEQWINRNKISERQYTVLRQACEMRGW